MKKLSIIFTAIILICRCNDSGSDSDKTRGLKFNPETLTTENKYNRPAMSYNIDYSGNKTGNYAIIYSGTVNSIKSVGIAVADNPAAATFNMKIYFPAESIPEENLSISEANSTVTINGTKSANHSINLNFIKEDDGTYTISSGTGDINGTPITINSIKARLAGADDSSRRK